MRMTATQVRKTKPKNKAYKLADGGGLYLLVRPTGRRYWRMDYRFAGKRKTHALGVYPDVTLKTARERHRDARQNLANEIDPGLLKQATRETSGATETFEAIAREWFAKQKPTWAKSHADKVMGRLERHVFPWLGNLPINDITAPQLLAVLRRIESHGITETAHRARQNCGQVFRYAIATGRAERDPSADLKGALPPTKTKHLASIKEPREVGALLRAIDGYTGNLTTIVALKLSPLIFLRPGEVRKAQWVEINLHKAEWRIPGKRMKKMDNDAVHIVPLSKQAVALLEEMQPVTGRGRYVFPSVRSTDRPMSENTVTAALRRLGYSGDEMTAHGFRGTASTLLNEQGWHPDAIERQLAHAEKDDTRAAYNFAQHLPERRRMMQTWADYLDSLKRGTDVIDIYSRQA